MFLMFASLLVLVGVALVIKNSRPAGNAPTPPQANMLVTYTTIVDLTVEKCFQYFDTDGTRPIYRRYLNQSTSTILYTEPKWDIVDNSLPVAGATSTSLLPDGLEYNVLEAAADLGIASVTVTSGCTGEVPPVYLGKVSTITFNTSPLTFATPCFQYTTIDIFNKPKYSATIPELSGVTFDMRYSAVAIGGLATNAWYIFDDNVSPAIVAYTNTADDITGTWNVTSTGAITYNISSIQFSGDTCLGDVAP